MSVRFSVLIPAYNVEKYICEAIDSVLKQTYHNYQIVIIDDGSTDNTASICDAYATNSNVVVIHQENRGLLSARRRGIAEADGDYCVFLDSDDYLDREALEKINVIIDRCQAEIVIFNTFLVNEDSNNCRIRKPVFQEDRLFNTKNQIKLIKEKLLFTSELNNLVLKVIKRDLISSDPCDYITLGNISMGEDLIQSFHPVDNARKIYYLNQCLYYYRQNPSSTMNKTEIDLEKQFSKFNLYGFEFRLMYAKKWGMNSKEELNKICEQSLNFFLDLFESTYRGCIKKKELFMLPWNDLFEQVTNTGYYLGINKYVRLQTDNIMKNRKVAYSLLLKMRSIKNHLKKR